jgi:hypothetical protein
MTRPRRPRIILTLEPLPLTPPGAPLAVRIRSVLKRLLRSYRFKCVALTGDVEDGTAFGGLDERTTPAQAPRSPADPAVRPVEGQDAPSGHPGCFRKDRMFRTD